MTPLDLLTAIGGTKSLSALDGFARAIWTDWGAGRLTDEQASALAETLEGRKREVRGIDTVAVRAPQVAEAARKQGRLSHFPPKRKAMRSPNRRASIERRRTLAAAAARQPIHDRRVGGVADRRRRRAGPGRLYADLGGDRGAGRGVRHDGAQCVAPGGARGSRHHRGAPAPQATEPRQCGAGRLARMAFLDRARAEKFERRPRKRPRFRFPGGRVQKNGVHGQNFFQKFTRRPRSTRSTCS